MKTLIVISAILLTFSAPVIAQKQGICGKVVWTSGNQMPGPGLQSSKPAGIVREIYIYEATSTTKVTEAGGFYSSVQTKLIKKVKTKKDGSFRGQSIKIVDPARFWTSSRYLIIAEK